MRLLPYIPSSMMHQTYPDLPENGCGTLLLGEETPGSDFLVFQSQQFSLTDQRPASYREIHYGLGSLLAFTVEMETRPSVPCIQSLEELSKLKRGKLLRLSLHDFNPASGVIVMDAWMLPGMVSHPSFAAECPTRRLYLQHVPTLMNWFHGFPLPAFRKIKVHKRYDYSALFDKVREYHDTQEVVEKIDVQHPILVPILRPYQRDAVCWMVSKEKVVQRDKGQLHVLWTQFKTLDDKIFYYNVQSGEITDQRQEMPGVFPGGILAEEMGLGKTVEVLAMILAHPRWPKDYAQETAMSCTPEDVPVNGVLEDSTGLSSSCDQMDSRVPKGHSVAADIPAHDKSKDNSSSRDNLQNMVLLSPKDYTQDKAMPSSPDNNLEDAFLKDSSKVGPPCSLGRLNSAEPQGLSMARQVDSQIQDKPVDSSVSRTILQNKAPISGSQDDFDDSAVADMDVTFSSQDSESPSSVAKSEQSSHPEVDGKTVNTHVPGDKLMQNAENPSPELSDNSIRIPETKVSVMTNEMATSFSVDGTNVKNLEANAKPKLNTTLSDIPAREDLEKISLETNTVQYASQAENQRSNTNHSRIDNDADDLKLQEDASLVEMEEGEQVSSQSGNQDEEASRDDEQKASSQRQEARVFQCTCGKSEENIQHPTCVQCLRCHSWLHAACIGFDIHMPQTPSQHLQFWCPNCHPKVDPLVSGATLIISPSSICEQWVDEINRHINSSTLKVMVYKGVKKKGYLQPKTLAEYDIVITTYSTLQMELDYANLSRPGTEERTLRHAKRYQTTPSPLPCVEWWRVCLDEAQMIECPTAKSAEMANRLSARNRWCVTGTPIQKSLDDLYGLFLFLGVEPYWVKHWWDIMLSIPYSHGHREPLQKALYKNFWRSAKKDVLDQIALPAQTEEVHWLDFSAIETYFYKRKHDDCSSNFRFKCIKTSLLPETKLSTLDRKSLQNLLVPLLRVRQACCHPHVVRGEFTTLQKKKQLSMEDLLKTMISKAELESEGAHRQLICAINALAAVHCIKDEIVEAASLYREVLKSAEEHRDTIKTDKLQMMHAVHNLSKLLEERSEVIEPREEDGDLSQRMVVLRNHYLQRTKNLVDISLQTLQPIRDKVLQHQEQIPSGPAWYLDGIQWAIYSGLGPELVDRVKTELESNRDAMGLANRFRDARGLQFVLVSEFDDLAKFYEAAWDGVTSLQSRLQDKELLAEATDCHLRPFKGRIKHTCAFCKVEDALQVYEMKLFSFDVRNLEAEDNAGPLEEDDDPNQDRFNLMAGGPRGNWATSEHERALRILHSFLRSCGTDDVTLDEGANFLDMIEQQRKEFKPLRAYWGAMRDRVAALDELEMAMMRLRVKLPGEETDPASQPYIIELQQIDQHRYRYLNDRLFAQNELRRKLGQLVYLQNLNKAQYDLKDGTNPDPCPICVRALGKQWTVLQCGHCFCNECMETMLRRVHVAGRQGAVRCAVCRTPTEGDDVSYVSVAPRRDDEERDDEAEQNIQVLGNHSTKIEAVVKTIKKIQCKEPGAKSIVFSTWSEVLELISKALTVNHIKFQNAGKGGGSKNFQTAVTEFKHDMDIPVLLLPVHSGSKGLNLIEATHVLLVEPILNPASEMQAIGRVHRIGQTKPTVVHRFLVRDTIEEKLHNYLTTQSISDGLNSVEADTGQMTFSDLKDLFASET